MARPQGNGLVALHDEPTKERSFFCLRLVLFLNEESEPGTDEYQQLWHERFEAVKNGSCHYKSMCPIYKRTVKSFQEITEK